MSHAPERQDKNCLNCGATVIGRFCHVCGQENIVPKESFGGLVLHFFYDITHFDGKFFHSVKYLLFRPGFLSKEFISGRRASHLNPVRMYVFTSAIFFLIFFFINDPKHAFKTNLNDPLTQKERADYLREFEAEYNKLEEDTGILSGQIRKLKDTSLVVTRGDLFSGTGGFFVNKGGKKYRSRGEYDSAQKKLPASKRDGWLIRTLQRKQIRLNEEYSGNPGAAIQELSATFLHRLPYLLFISLPIFALILKLLYVRRKQFYYADHAIFSIHHYVFSFILLLLIFLLGAVKTNPSFGWLLGVQVALFIIWPVYLYIAMLNFYKQKWFKTFVKFVALNILGVLALIILFAVFFFLSIFEL